MTLTMVCTIAVVAGGFSVQGQELAPVTSLVQRCALYRTMREAFREGGRVDRGTVIQYYRLDTRALTVTPITAAAGRMELDE